MHTFYEARTKGDPHHLNKSKLFSLLPIHSYVTLECIDKTAKGTITLSQWLRIAFFYCIKLELAFCLVARTQR